MVERLKSNYKVLAFMVVLFVFTVFVKSSEINAAVAGNGRIYGIFNATGTTGKYVNGHDEPAIKCMKKVKYMNIEDHVVCTKAGKLYYYDIDGKLSENGEKLPLKQLIATGM